ncbi:sugar ABC transporter permease [bacterium]|nr:MAG: sugar ABC transporter permease [bacterium]
MAYALSVASQRVRRNLVGYAFVSPWIVGFLVFTLWPFLRSIQLSFTRYNIVSPPRPVGLANYRILLTDDPMFWKSLQVTLTYTVMSVPLGILAGVGIALLLNIEIKGMAIWRTVFYLPSVVPAVAGSLLFVWIFNPQVGLINVVLRTFGIIGPSWLTDPKWALPSLVIHSLWGVGGSMVIYLAGLKDVPRELLESSTLDGANAWHRTRRITLPLLTPVIFFNLVMGVIGAFGTFTNAYIMTNGGPDGATMFYALYLYQRAWLYLDMGYASAMAWVLFAIVVTLTAVVFRTGRRWVHYNA